MFGSVSAPTDSDFREWAGWFKCLADATRLRILHHVAGLDEPTSVGEIVEALSLTQSNVSHHLRVLAEQRFVLLEPHGVRTLVSANPLCMVELPEAAAAIMGHEAEATVDSTTPARIARSVPRGC